MNTRMLTLSIAIASATGLALSSPVFAEYDTDDLPAELAQNLDLNGDGVIGPQERARAERLRERIDWNHDGTIDDAERERAQRAFEYADRNEDGELSAQERIRNRYTYNRRDVNDDGHIGQYERRFAYELRDSASMNGANANRQR
jgi:hypothetical protein